VDRKTVLSNKDGVSIFLRNVGTNPVNFTIENPKHDPMITTCHKNLKTYNFKEISRTNNELKE
jgi:hypothetical protein